MERLFSGRLPLAAASASYFFSAGTLVQRLMHQIKYRNDQPLAVQMGRLMGEQILSSGRFPVDGLIPLPLFPARERRRGYNQARLLCQGIHEVTRFPIMDSIVTRPEKTTTQTKKSRIERWQNMEGKFFLTAPGKASNRHLLLVDDVITTGATLESCGNTLLAAGNVTLSIASLCLATR